MNPNQVFVKSILFVAIDYFQNKNCNTFEIGFKCRFKIDLEIPYQYRY